ncbi:hypothetical protein BURMUCF2_0789 [Burkholderia multivorans CF2]|nr:hypothetical protein BURMUCF2_0789 [Burkholderia multivorans CF2]
MSARPINPINRSIVNHRPSPRPQPTLQRWNTRRAAQRAPLKRAHAKNPRHAAGSRRNDGD